MARAASLLITASLITGSLFAQPLDHGQVKARIFVTPDDAPLQVELNDGRVLEGKLSGKRDDSFGLRIEEVAVRERSGTRSYTQWIAYREVAELRGAEALPTTSSRELIQRLRLGDEVNVRTLSGNVYEGEIEDLNDERMVIHERTVRFSEEDLMRIDITRKDSLVNGTLVGLGVGLGVGTALALLGCSEGCTSEEATEVFLVFGGVGAGIGAGIGILSDSLRRERETLFVTPDRPDALAIVPFITRDRKGVVVSFRF